MFQRLQLIFQARSFFEQRQIDRHLLEKLYAAYNPIPNIEAFVEQSQTLFPRLNCGLASLYLQYVLKEGLIHQGSYERQAHTFLRLDKDTIIDITADQYGGPAIYYGPIKNSWSL